MVELQALVAKAVPFLAAGDGSNALRILEPIVDSFVYDWLEHASGSDEQVYELFEDLGRLMAEAALMSELPAKRRRALAATVRDWQKRLEDYGVDEGFHVAVRALETGWDDPALAAAMAGTRKTWPPARPGDRVDEQLTAVRLRVLEACDRTQDYLNLAHAARAHASHAEMLVKLGRRAEAVAYGRETFRRADEALVLATALRARAAHDDALKIAEAGLALAGGGDEQSGASVVPLARWLRDYAGGIGRTALALKSARVAFAHSLTHDDFNAAKPWAGTAWKAVRAELLAHLTRAPRAYDRTKIYLSEGLIDDAVRSVGNRPGYRVYDGTLMALATAAAASHPDWVIRMAMKQAASIMDENRASQYEVAVQWLGKVALAYEASGRQRDWNARLEDLIERHRRKHKLRPMLEKLRKARDRTGRTAGR